MHEKMYKGLANLGGRVEAVFFCPHTAADNCDCRKPKSGLFEQIGERFGLELRGVPVVGDSLRDLEAGVAVGCIPHLVLTGKGVKTRGQGHPARRHAHPRRPGRVRPLADCRRCRPQGVFVTRAQRPLNSGHTDDLYPFPAVRAVPDRAHAALRVRLLHRLPVHERRPALPLRAWLAPARDLGWPPDLRHALPHRKRRAHGRDARQARGAALQAPVRLGNRGLPWR